MESGDGNVGFDFGTGFVNETGGNELYDGTHEEGNKELADDTSPAKRQKIQDANGCDEENPPTNVNHGVDISQTPEGGDDKTDKEETDVKSVQQLLTDFSQDTKQVHMSWIEAFRNCEEYELFCPTRLEKILDEAKNLEQHLLEQKSTLKQRLQVLSQTLQLLE